MSGAKLSFTDAMRAYLPVVYALWLADLIVAGWLVNDLPLNRMTVLVYLGVALGMMLVTALFGLVFAAKDVWWRRLIAKKAAAIVEMNDGTIDLQHATDLLTCEGPCRDAYGCMVGVCAQAEVRRAALRCQGGR